MADSDDEYDRRRRDKFRKERSDYQERRDDRGRREEWVDSRRDSWSRDRNRRDYRDYDPRRRSERYSPPRHDLSPPMKRMRRGDWDDRNSYPAYDIGYGGGAMVGSHQNWGPPHDLGGSAHGQHGYGGPGSGQRNDQDLGPTQPPMMTFKQFLASQDDTISDEEAVKKYNEYKLEFRRQQLNEFFLSHKEEEWFKSKYHPEECGRRQADQMSGLKRRLDVFLEMVENSRIDSVSIDSDRADEIVKLLDAVVIKLEGGTDLDLKILDQILEEPEKIDKHEPYVLDKKEEPEKKKEKLEKDKAKDPSKPLQLTISSEQKELQRKAKEFLKKTGAGKDAAEKNDKKRKRNKEYNYDEIEDSGSDSDSGSDTGGPEEKAGEDEPPPPGLEESVSSNDASKAEPPEADGEVLKVEEEQKGDASPIKEVEKSSVSPPRDAPGPPEDEEDPKSNEPPAEPENEEPEEIKPRPLHKTCSIFLRNLAPTITKQEVEAMCKRYPGFLRVAIADPQPERRFFRRGWVTFERGVNIKEICWNLNNIRLRDCELGAIVNRDLARRIRSVNGITSHKQVVRADIKLAAKIIQNLDSRHELWTDDQETADGSIPSFGLISKNPLLKNITDYLIEEASAEEEELLGTAHQEEKAKENEGSDTTVERDDTLIKVIDRLVLYLRIVHSVDYYNHSDYPNEDEMPNRCGILHARGPPPSNKVTQNEVSEYIGNFEQKINPFLQPLTKLSSDESTKLGKKDPEAEVEKFIVANTQELAKDKWLCPLSGKKFKGPEFVRKHIFNKHGEKIEEVKKEVEYFNNYLTDPKRPQLPEHPGNKGPNNSIHMGGNRSDGFGMPQPGYMPAPQYGYAGYGQTSRGAGPVLYTANYGGRGDNFRSGGYYSKRGRGPPQRELIQYRDLDAPNDVDIF